MSNRLTGTHEIDHGDGTRTFVATAESKYGTTYVRSTTLYDSSADAMNAERIADTIRDVENA